MFGKEISLPADLMFTPPDDRYRPQFLVEYVEWVHKAHRVNFEKAREHLAKAAVRQKTNFDKRACSRSIRIGQWVLRYYPALLAGNKLACPYKGPYLVISQPNPVTFKIQESEVASPITVHVNDLTVYYGPNHPDSRLPSSSVDASTGSDVSARSDASAESTESAKSDLSARSDVTVELTASAESDVSAMSDTSEVSDVSVDFDIPQHHSKLVSDRVKFNGTSRPSRRRRAPQRFGWD